jgi:hypothetical protein
VLCVSDKVYGLLDVSVDLLVVNVSIWETRRVKTDSMIQFAYAVCFGLEISNMAEIQMFQIQIYWDTWHSLQSNNHIIILVILDAIGD